MPGLLESPESSVKALVIPELCQLKFRPIAPLSVKRPLDS